MTTTIPVKNLSALLAAQMSLTDPVTDCADMVVLQGRKNGLFRPRSCTFRHSPLYPTLSQVRTLGQHEINNASAVQM